MADSFERRLGELDGATYLLFIKVWPSWNDPAEFVAAVVRRRIHPRTGEPESVQVARIENRAHGHTHIDRLWTREQDMEPFHGAWHDAWACLSENWRRYARRYREAHG